MSNIVAIVIALIVVAIVWKVLKGLIRTAGLVLILGGAAYFAYSQGMLG